ncbi:MAG TPA: carbonic anhydrase family protein [Phenylobacterium sp.]|nr:carbonic anhydrase family protein [Phenylobacterium sp.]
MRSRVRTGAFVVQAAAIAAVAVFAATPGWAQWRTPWSYAKGPNGPEQWGDIDPDYAACKTGRGQSPIDIASAGAAKADLPPLRFAFKDGPVRIVNNGYTAVRVDYAAGNGNVLTIGGRRYELTQFHFHHPSEEELDGKRFAMNAHVMLKGDDGKVIGVTVFVKAGRANPAVTKLWAHMPPQKGPLHAVPGLTVNPGDLLPKALGYFLYTGSISAPPCNGDIAWYVLKAPLEVSPAQIEAFARLYPNDVRPIQPLNGRVVQASGGR